MKLIDGNELWVQIYRLQHKRKWKNRTDIAFRECLNIIQFFPKVDAEPVVRCKDCRFYRFYDGTFGKGWMCFENNTARQGNDYCSRGERRDDETD